jgi:HPt (histidine-containing phosphotransfer) domain-containing protein
MDLAEQRQFAADFETAKKRFEQRFGRTASDDAFAPLFNQLESRLASEALRRLDRGANWSELPTRSLRAIRRHCHSLAAVFGTLGDVDIERLCFEIEETAKDDERLTDNLHETLVEIASWEKEKDSDAINIEGAIITLGAASIRGRVELARRDGN